MYFVCVIGYKAQTVGAVLSVAHIPNENHAKKTFKYLIQDLTGVIKYIKVSNVRQFVDI